MELAVEWGLPVHDLHSSWSTGGGQSNCGGRRWSTLAAVVAACGGKPPESKSGLDGSACVRKAWGAQSLPATAPILAHGRHTYRPAHPCVSSRLCLGLRHEFSGLPAPAPPRLPGPHPPTQVRGAATGEGLGNAFLSHIAAVDGIFHVCRAFEDADVIHVEDRVDPVGGETAGGGRERQEGRKEGCEGRWSVRNGRRSTVM